MTNAVRSLLSRVKLPGGEVFTQLLTCGFNEPRVLEYALNLVGGGVAADILFLQHLPEIRPLFDTVDDVLEDLILTPRAVVSAKEPVPEGSSSLGHFRSQPPFPFLMSEDDVTPRAYVTRRDKI